MPTEGGSYGWGEPIPPDIEDYYGPNGRLSLWEQAAYKRALKAYEKAWAEWRRSNVASSTGTRSGDAWAATVSDLGDNAEGIIRDIYGNPLNDPLSAAEEGFDGEYGYDDESPPSPSSRGPMLLGLGLLFVVVLASR